jgi:YggT family protein
MSQNRMSEVRTSRRESGQDQRLFSFKVTQLIWLGLVMLEALIAMRIGLKLIGANPDNPFAAFVYNVSHIFLFPFEGLVGTPAANGMVLELSSFIAMVVYALLAWAFERSVWLIFYRPRGSAVGVTQTTTSEPVAVVQSTTREPVAVIQTTTREEYTEST